MKTFMAGGRVRRARCRPKPAEDAGEAWYKVGTRSVASSSSAAVPRRRARPVARPPRLRDCSSSSLLGYNAGTMYQGDEMEGRVGEAGEYT
uniref:Uncharacterized protein n=1 Tax=Oryza glumipatula TaxID=40148 RepID=A0A0E0A842_9ORYZ